MLVAGTSLVVYPVAGLVEYLAPGAQLVILNRDPTPMTAGRTWCCRGDLVEELEAIGESGNKEGRTGLPSLLYGSCFLFFLLTHSVSKYSICP